MNEFAWCRPLLRVVGVLLLGLSLPTLIDYVFRVVERMATSQRFGVPFGPGELGWFLIYLLGAGSQCALGLYLLFKGRRVLRWVLHGVDTCCTRCGYQLAGTVGGRCPECGLEQHVANIEASQPPAAP